MPCIAVDLTPIRPGGENGGAKVIVLQLLSDFKNLASNYDFLLLTAHWNHEELAFLEGPSFRRLCVLPREAPATSPRIGKNHVRLDQILYRLRQTVPLQAVSLLRPPVKRLKGKFRSFFRRFRPAFYPRGAGGGLLQAHQVNLLFCPFTTPAYAEPGIPVVCVVYDLQHHAYPQFFDPAEISVREATYEQVRQRADAIICISEYSRQTLLDYLDIAAERTHTVYISIHARLKNITPSPDILSKFQLEHRPYMFYPANYWPHKNHRMLLTAYKILVQRRPDSAPDLVLAGALEQQEQELRLAVEAMGLKQRVHFLGYLAAGPLAAVFQGCRFVIFPSLYEGFGVPVLEAFTFGKPVLCSNVTSLPEVVGDAAILFDPRKPLEIVQAIETLLQQPRLADELVKRGYQRLANFRQEDMARRYLEIFDQILQQEPLYLDSVVGVYDDGWIGSQLELSRSTFGPGRILELKLAAPAWLPYRKLTLQQLEHTTLINEWELSRGEEITLKFPLPAEAGRITLNSSPVFQPKDHTNSTDERWLSCLCQSCCILYPDGSKNSLFKQPEIE